jgi:putative Mg2+ transporter-C (MgtC) family protein
MYTNGFDWNELLFTLLKVTGAFVLAFPIAWEREQSTRVMGLRTFPLVAVASCVYVLMAIAVVGEDADPQARIIQGLMGGIGFIGGGAILKEGSSVRGTATAASVWSTGALGACVAYGLYDIAVVLSLVNYLILRLLTPIERKVGQDAQDE